MRYLALALALAACKHSPPADCGKKAAEVAAFLRAADQGPTVFLFAPLAPPLRDDVTDHGEQAPQIEISADGITYQGQLVGGRDDLAARLHGTHDMIVEGVQQGRFHSRRPVDPDLIAIVADEHAPMASVAAAVEAAQQSGFSNAMFVFRRTPVADPPRTPLDDEIDKVLSGDPARTASSLAKLASEKIERCPALKKSFGAVAAVEEDKAKFLIDSIEPSLKDCGCAVDPYTVRTIMWRILKTSSPAGVLRVKLDPSAPPIHATTWGEASKQLTPATKTAWFN